MSTPPSVLVHVSTPVGLSGLYQLLGTVIAVKGKSEIIDVCGLDNVINKTHGEHQRILFLPEVPADLPDVFQGVCYLLLLNIIEFHLEASAGKQHSPASPNESTKGTEN